MDATHGPGYLNTYFAVIEREEEFATRATKWVFGAGRR